MAEDYLNSQSNARDAFDLEARIVAGLETRPPVMIPPGFAARVAGQLPPPVAVDLRARRFGPIVALACLALLVAWMPAFGKMASTGAVYAIAAEVVLSLQFVLLTVWIVARTAGYTLPSRS